MAQLSRNFKKIAIQRKTGPLFFWLHCQTKMSKLLEINKNIFSIGANYDEY